MTNPSFSEITHKTALITGAGRRIGRALAERLGNKGWSVAVHYNRSKTEADTVAAAIEQAGGRAVAVQADLADPDNLGTLIARASQSVGPLGCLINNASIFERDEADTATIESWDAHMDINLRAPFLLSQGFAKQLPGNARGVIINIVDERVWNLSPYFMSYTVSKAGLWTLTQTMAMAFAPRIRVNAIGPGPALPSSRQGQDQFEQQCASTPLKRGTNPAQICDAMEFILSAPAMTGQMIALDGGQHLNRNTNANSDYVAE